MPEYVIQGLYSPSIGWEDLTWDETEEDADRSLREYNENEKAYPHRIVVREAD